VRKIQTLLLIVTLLLSSGCLGGNLDGTNDDLGNEDPIAPCLTKNLDANLVGEWIEHTFPEFSSIPKTVEFTADGTRIISNTDPDFAGLEYCWTIENGSLIEGYHWDEQGIDQISNSFFHVTGDLFFLAIIKSTYDDGTQLSETFSDKPTECKVYSRDGAYTDTQSRNAAINATTNPNFCTWIWADPAGASPTDAWNATYLATDHSDVLSTATNDNLMTIELDDFYGEIDWYVSEGYFGFWTEITIDGTTHLCVTGTGLNCTITFSGVDEYYAVWEEGEIATLSENGVDICSATCDVEITNFGLREEDTLAGTTQLTIS
jgi:hypothetical protein